MSLKDTIVQWSEGVDLALGGKAKEAIAVWSAMQEPGARIYFNIASMYVLLESLDNAEKNLDLAIQKDPHLALAYFQRGTLRLQRERYIEGLKDLNAALKNLRGNQLIDYKQLGLQYKLYSCEVMYNHAYGLYYSGRTAEAREELEGAKVVAASTTESRHKFITAALEKIRLGTKFQPYKLDNAAMVFQPPRNKREVLKPVNFLGKAKVLSSLVDQDSYVGFVGVQAEKQRRTPSPRPGVTPPPPSQREGTPTKQPKPALPPPARIPKPDIPPPAPEMKIRPRTSSLDIKRQTRPHVGGKDANMPSRPPKPVVAPPPLHTNKGDLPVKPAKYPDADKQKKSGLIKSKSTGMMTVKVHYSTTRALRVSTSITYQQLQNLICKKFGQPEDSLTLWCKKKNGELKEIKCEKSLREVSALLDDGFRLTLWAYDKHETSDDEESDEELEDLVLLECVATHAYKGQYEDELSFNAGDTVEVTADINADWYEGQCNGMTGIFPKSYVKET